MKDLISEEKIAEILDKIGALVEMRAKEMCPVDLGALRASIRHRVEGDTVIIFSDVEYAKDIEFGKPAEPLSQGEQEDIKEWAERHGVSPQGMVKHIRKFGIKVGTPEQPLHITSFGRDSFRPFMRPAIHQSVPDIKRLVKQELG